MTKKKTASKKLKPDDLTALVQQVALRDLRLVGCKTLFATPEIGLPESLEQSINVKTARGDGDDSNRLTCVITFRIVGNHADSELPEGVNALNLEAMFALLYDFESLGGVSNQQLQEFGQRNALFNVWPYWREFVQTMTTRMGMPPLKVPLMRPGKLEFTEDKQSPSDGDVPTPAEQKHPTKKKRRS